MAREQKFLYYLRTAALVVSLGGGSSAHALCVNNDGSLDDSSMNTASIDRGLLPSCDIDKPTAAPASNLEAVESQGVAKQAINTPNAKKEINLSSPSTQTQSDCLTAKGESREGTLGAAEMLPPCNE